jgi:hypothetical protein
MADELKQSQLARIVVPAITDVKYAEGMADAFDKINDNFKKIASLPFLQGVQGDSYQLEEYPIWEKDKTENWILTEDGKVLLNSIFGKDVTVEGSSFDNIRNYIGEELDGVSPIDFFKNENDIVNNILYFYVIKDDTDSVIEKQIGQFYYFIDGRIKNIGTVYGDKTSSELLSTFNDYTGFYQYNAENNTYTRLEILPSIYYDQNKNDICWKFNGNETGISAIGVEGRPGKDATLSIVLVEAGPSDNSAVVAAEFKYLEGNTSAIWDDKNLDDIAEGKAIICCRSTNFGGEESFNFAYGELIRGGDGILSAYWNPGTLFSHVINDMKITTYFYDMGDNAVSSAPHYLAIPSDSNRNTGNLSAAHVIRNSKGDLEFFNTTDAFVSPEEQKRKPTGVTGANKDVILSNYNFNVGPKGNNNKSVRISSDTVKIGATTYIGTTGAVIDGGLSVKNLTVHPGKTNIHGETNIYDGHLYLNDRRGATSPKGIVIENGDIQLRKGNIGVTGAINATESIVANKNLEATTGNLTVGNNGHIQGKTLTLGITGSTTGTNTGRSTTVITNTGDNKKSYFSLNVNGVETGHNKYFTINSSAPLVASGSNYNTARISLGSTASQIKENFIQICAGEDVVYGNKGARAGIQIHSSSNGTSGDVKIKPNLTVEGPGTFNGLITGDSGATFKGNVTVTNNSTTTTNGNLVIVGASTHSNDSSSDFNTLLNSGNHGQLLIGVPKNQDDGTYRMFLNRASIQTYAYGTTGSTSGHTVGSLYLNPCGGGVILGSSSKSTSLNVYGQSTFYDKSTFRGEITGNTGATFKGNVVITNTTSSSSTDTGALRVTGGISTKEKLHVGQELTAHQYINIANSSDATAEQGGSGISGLTDSNKAGHIYLGAPPSNKTDAINRMLINRHTIQAYTTWDTGNKYKSPAGSSLYLNPCGGHVNISKSGSTTTINGNAIINEGATIKDGATITGGLTVDSIDFSKYPTYIHHGDGTTENYYFTLPTYFTDNSTNKTVNLNDINCLYIKNTQTSSKNSRVYVHISLKNLPKFKPFYIFFGGSDSLDVRWYLNAKNSSSGNSYIEFPRWSAVHLFKVSDTQILFAGKELLPHN